MQSGKAEATSAMLAISETPLPYEPYTEGIYADGTPEEIVVQGKNVFQPFAEETEINGVTFTPNADGTVTVNGTATAEIIYNISKKTEASPQSAYCKLSDIGIEPDTNYILNGCPTNGSARTYRQQLLVYGSGAEPVDYGSGSNSFSFSASDIADKWYRLAIRIFTGVTLNNLVFKPMIRLASDTDATYVPYHHETANAENLFAVEDIEDTQDIITGKVTRRTEAVVSDGTTPTGRYVGTVGEGNIIVKVREDGYTGEIASFETEEETPLNGLIVEMEPQQDLHGYDSPWPAGGGVNKLDPSQATRVTSSFNGLSIDWNAIEGYCRVYGTWNTSAASGGFRAIEVPSEIVNLNVKGFETTGHATCRWQTGENRIVIDLTGMVQDTAYDIKVYPIVYEGSTAPTVWSPYSNICPISGWTGVSVTRDGKNLFNGTITQLATYNVFTTGVFLKAGTYTATWFWSGTFDGVYIRPNNNITDSPIAFKYDSNSCTFTLAEDRTVYVQGYKGGGADASAVNLQIEQGSTATAYEPYTGNQISVTFGALGKNLLDLRNLKEGTWNKWDIPNHLEPDTTYTFSVMDASYSYGLFLTKNHTETGDGSSVRLAPYIRTSSTFTTPSDVKDYPWIILGGSSGEAGHASAKFQVEQGSSASVYEPYNDTIYSGYIDLVSGELVGDMKNVPLSIFDFTQISSPDTHVFRAYYMNVIPDISPHGNGSLIYSDLCDSFGYKAWSPINASDNGKFAIAPSTTDKIVFIDHRFSTSEDFQNAVKDVRLCYELATPLRWRLPPQVVETLRGLNNIWSNAGAIAAYVPTGDLIEQVEKQKLSTAEGDNTITVTAEVDDITFDVEYKKEADAG